MVLAFLRLRQTVELRLVSRRVDDTLRSRVAEDLLETWFGLLKRSWIPADDGASAHAMMGGAACLPPRFPLFDPAWPVTNFGTTVRYLPVNDGLVVNEEFWYRLLTCVKLEERPPQHLRNWITSLFSGDGTKDESSDTTTETGFARGFVCLPHGRYPLAALISAAAKNMNAADALPDPPRASKAAAFGYHPCVMKGDDLERVAAKDELPPHLQTALDYATFQ